MSLLCRSCGSTGRSSEAVSQTVRWTIDVPLLLNTVADVPVWQVSRVPQVQAVDDDSRSPTVPAR